MFTDLVECTGKIVSLTTPAAGASWVMNSITQLIVDAGQVLSRPNAG